MKPSLLEQTIKENHGINKIPREAEVSFKFPICLGDGEQKMWKLPPDSSFTVKKLIVTGPHSLGYCFSGEIINPSTNEIYQISNFGQIHSIFHLITPPYPPELQNILIVL